ncbi:Fe-S protein assembly chaperone HscA [Occallatibacter riparius]|uniref:Fe-S protein assembly chaperone HscA n=1 Tax=Occallatibacter riparius TaxID=1002689 RepID=A0A9J7BWT7_9BACT|nr:Fe-S protein assembly chaperone HscA [Occallatibacter riparius]UWZ85501.1 Fe-S protein assembly chaperone HscA [Occallatibacter riparius]
MAEGRVVGIDLGTTNSLVAYMEGEKPVVIPGVDGSNLVPSVVALDPMPKEGGRPTVTVGNSARKSLIETPERVIYSVKRLMGRGLSEVQKELRFFPFRLAEDAEEGEVPRIQLGELKFTPPEISAYVLRQLKRNAERFFGTPVTQAVITVPAYFNDAQRQATKDAGRMAGLEVLRLVNEPTAAALAYGLDRAKEGTIAVYDLGGGTFDISILKLRDGIFEVQSTNGDTHLGGDDIDNLLVSIALDEVYSEHGVDLRSQPGAVQAIRKAAIDAKIRLSHDLIAQFEIELPNGDRYQREIPREVYEQLIEPILERTAGPCKQAILDAGLTSDQIDEVVLVGGSTRIPAVRKLVDELFQLSARGKKAHTELNPDEVVALGAAVQADILAGASKATEELLLLDVTPLSLGIEALGGTVAKIIQRNSTIPASATEHFTTGVDGQTNVAIHVVQGERELASDCRSLARFDLKGIPPMSAGLPRIEVKFLIDADGILHVSAREQRSGKEAQIEVKPTYGLTDEQVESMILDSFDHAEEDFAKRLLIEARNEAETILSAVERAPEHSVWKQLTGEEQARIAAARDHLASVKLGDDMAAIREATVALDQATRHFAELMMESAVTTAIRGKTMDAAGEELDDNVTAPHPMAPAEFK